MDNKTLDNLKTAFARESQANHRYLYFADKAEKEGHHQIGRLFRAIAEAETVHARNHLDLMVGTSLTKDILEEIAGEEQAEFYKNYPGFVSQAKAEGNKRAEISFDRVRAVEKVLYDLCHQAYRSLESDQKMKEDIFFVCQNCGNTVVGTAPKNCQFCGSLRAGFKKVE